jgi:heavy metal sensor kinase
MRSIRLSLLVYFLGLLALALGAVSVLVYQTTQQRLEEQKRNAEKLLKAQYDDRASKEQAQLDDKLNNDAHILAREAASRVDSRIATQMTLTGFWFRERFNTSERLDIPGFWDDRPDRPDRPERRRAPPPPLRGHSLAGLDALLVALNPMGGHALNPFWLAEAAHGPFAPAWHDDNRPVIQLDEDGLPLRLELAKYYQIDGTWQRTYRSESLGDTSFPFDPEAFHAGPVYEFKFDDVELRPGLTVRRVTLKAPFGRAFFVRTRFGPPPPGNSPPPPPPQSQRPEMPPQWAMLIQCGYDTDYLAEMLSDLEARRKVEVAEIEERNDSTLASLRFRLLIMSLATFAAVVVGVYFLVRLGLMPLRRLGDAVSRVSEKDFRLQFDEAHLPTELVPIVDRLKQTLDQLRSAFEREKQAAADISHELRTPVAALLTTIEVALKKPRKPDEYREILAECRESGQQISQLVERLLTLARIDAGVDRLRVEKVDVAALAEQCTALVRPLAEARGLKLRLHSEGEALLKADPGKLREVLTNLLHNAIEYNRPQGSVDLTVGRHNGTLRVEVRDTGVGIAPEARAHIFERFYRADPSRHAEGLHAGLGLAIVKGYVDLMGGSINVESAPGQGSTFRVELPAA